MFKKFIYILILFIFWVSVALARGGGGGSSSGGGSGSFSSSGSVSSTGGLKGPISEYLYIISSLIIFSGVFLYIEYKKRKKIKKAKEVINNANIQDQVWNENDITKRVSEVFYSFQKDWSDLNIENMRSYLTEDYYKRMVLELNVLRNENRKNLMQNVAIENISIIEAKDDVGEKNDSFIVEIIATANDSLIDIKLNKKLYADNSQFTEYWNFSRDGNIWKLNVIKQATENTKLVEKDIVDFAERNNFYFDPDFGWLMMPHRGVIFNQSNFKNSDINNHVIGYFKGKIVEFYTFIGNTDSKFSNNYFVSQTVLPISYNNILVRRKRKLFNFSPSGLRRIKTESNDFDKKFCLWAHKDDQISSFELLPPDFMEKIYELPFELNIEIVDNFLYFYSKDRSGINHDKMLEILSWAFDEMER